jgi:di/tricarboxylate transporter
VESVTPAVLALLALMLAIGLSMTTHINVGLLAISLAWAIGVYAADMKVEAVIAGFPGGLFLTLAGVTFLFAIAKANGTLDILARQAARAVMGNAGLLPIMFFLLTGVLSTVGPGSILSVALIAPIAMPAAAAAGVPNLLTAIMVGTGANAGNMSPVSSVGAMVGELMTGIGLPDQQWLLWSVNFSAHVLVATAAYFLFGGPRLLRAGAATHQVEVQKIARKHWITIVATLSWMVGVIVWRVNPGLAAFAVGTVLMLLRVAEERDVIPRIPLDVILMVTGVTMLIGVLEATGGMDLFTGMIARIATPATLNGVIALVTGAISTYSSTSGVVLPAFLPMVPGLVRQVGGGDPLAVALSINVGSALVDVSPLSTLGALCVATVVDRAEAQNLFRKLLFWGLSMILVGGILAGLFAGLVAGL